MKVYNGKWNSRLLHIQEFVEPHSLQKTKLQQYFQGSIHSGRTEHVLTASTIHYIAWFTLCISFLESEEEVSAQWRSVFPWQVPV